MTSTISLHEVATAYVHEEYNVPRKFAAWVVSIGVFIIGVFASLSFGVLKEYTIGGLTIFNALDFLTAKIMMPLGGMMICVFVGLRIEKKILKEELEKMEKEEMKGKEKKEPEKEEGADEEMKKMEEELRK